MAVLVALAILALSTIVAAGDFKIQYPFGTDLFLVSKDGDTNATNLNVLTKLDASLATTVDFAADALSESYIDFDTVCGTGNHLYISGNDLACEADDDGIAALTLSADTGTPESIGDTDTITIAGGTTGIDTSVAATDTVTIDLDWTEVAADAIVEAKLDFDTTCGTGNHLYISGNDLACEADQIGGGMEIGDYEFMLWNQTEVNATYIEETEIDTLAELNTKVTDATLVDTGTLTDGKWCVYDSAGTEIDCNVDPAVGNTTEEMQDAIGSGISGANDGLEYNDAGNTFNFDCSDVTDSETDLGCSGEDVLINDNFVYNNGDDITGNLNFGAAANVTLNDASRITGGSDSWMQIDSSGNVVILLS